MIIGNRKIIIFPRTTRYLSIILFYLVFNKSSGYSKMFHFRNKFRKKIAFSTWEEMKCPKFTSSWCTLKCNTGIPIFSTFGHLCSDSHCQLPTQPGNERSTPSGDAQVRTAQCIYATIINFTGKYWVLSQKLAQNTFQKLWWFLRLFFFSSSD